MRSALVVSRLADIIFMQAVRAHVESVNAESDNGWFAALADRRLGAALRLLHKDLSATLTVESLVQAACMSRSAFALRFKEKIGQSPLDYLTRWRMFRASHLLRRTDKSNLEVAGSVGYESEAAGGRLSAAVSGHSVHPWVDVCFRPGAGIAPDSSPDRACHSPTGR